MVGNGSQINNNTESLKMFRLLSSIFTNVFHEPYRCQHYKLS